MLQSSAKVGNFQNHLKISTDLESEACRAFYTPCDTLGKILWLVTPFAAKILWLVDHLDHTPGCQVICHSCWFNSLLSGGQILCLEFPRKCCSKILSDHFKNHIKTFSETHWSFWYKNYLDQSISWGQLSTLNNSFNIECFGMKNTWGNRP